MAEFLTALSNAGNFTRDDFALVYRAKNKDATESSCRFVLQKLLDSGSIARVGRNNYCVNDKTSRKYTHEYSDLATSVAGKIRETYPELDFRIFELVQLNEFVNHQIAHNAVFIFVEGDLVALTSALVIKAEGVDHSLADCVGRDFGKLLSLQ